MGAEQNGQTKSHDVEIVMGEVSTGEQVRELEEYVSLAYARLSERAKAEKMVILSTVQNMTAYQMPNGDPGMAFSIIAHRISQWDLAQAQAAQRFGMGGKP